jgi:hypothetical protein
MRQKRTHSSSEDGRRGLIGLTPTLTNFYHNSRRFPLGIKRECGAGKFPLCRGCPRNCKRRILRHAPLGISVLGRRRRVTTREPGDLPSAVVTREDAGRGVQALASPELFSARGGNSGTQAQTPPSDQLPPVEISAPTDQNRTRAKPTYDEGSGARRVALNPAPANNPNSAPGTAANVVSQDGGQGGGGTPVRQFAGIVGTSATVITAEEIAHSPAQTLQEIIAQVPGVQLQSFYGGVNGAKTSVDLRGFGAFAWAPGTDTTQPRPLPSMPRPCRSTATKRNTPCMPVWNTGSTTYSRYSAAPRVRSALRRSMSAFRRTGVRRLLQSPSTELPTENPDLAGCRRRFPHQLRRIPDAIGRLPDRSGE